MATDVTDLHWLDPHRSIEQGELATMCCLTVAELDELVEYGALVPVVVDAGSAPRQFSAACVAPLREAVRLRGYYDLDLFTVSLLLGYLQRIDHLEHQLRALQAHVPHPQVLPRAWGTGWSGCGAWGARHIEPGQACGSRQGVGPSRGSTCGCGAWACSARSWCSRWSMRCR